MRGSAIRAASDLRSHHEDSALHDVLVRLRILEFTNEAMLFGAGLLVSPLPLVVLLSSFASKRVDDDFAFHLGLGGPSSGIVGWLFTNAPASVNATTISSLVFVALGTFAVASSLQQIYEKAFEQSHRPARGLYRLLVWTVVLCAAVALESAATRAVSAIAADVFGYLVTFAIMTPFFWWSMHFLLAGRVHWTALAPSAVATGTLFTGLGMFSKFYFGTAITSDNRTYGLIGAVFGITTWFIAIGAVIIIGAVTGVAWLERRTRRRARSAPP